MKKLIGLRYNPYCRICGKPTFENGCLNCDQGLAKTNK
jgi:hypothetical protein